MKTIAALLVLTVIAFGGYRWWARRAAGPVAGSAFELCTKDLVEMLGRGDAALAGARTRCLCVLGELEKSADGRDVIAKVERYGAFLNILESGASHDVAFEAMRLCVH